MIVSPRAETNRPSDTSTVQKREVSREDLLLGRRGIIGRCEWLGLWQILRRYPPHAAADRDFPISIRLELGPVPGEIVGLARRSFSIGRENAVTVGVRSVLIKHVEVAPFVHLRFGLAKGDQAAHGYNAEDFPGCRV